jgi:hypothetical protein
MMNADCTEKRLYVCSTPSFDQTVTRPCPLGYFAYKNKCFYNHPQLANFKDAKQTCAEHGGQLINVYDRATYQFIRAYSFYYSIPDIFLGLNLTTNISTRFVFDFAFSCPFHFISFFIF